MLETKIPVNYFAYSGPNGCLKKKVCFLFGKEKTDQHSLYSKVEHVIQCFKTDEF